MLTAGMVIVCPLSGWAAAGKNRCSESLRSTNTGAAAAGWQQPRPCVRYREVTYGAQTLKTSLDGRHDPRQFTCGSVALLALGGAECHLFADERMVYRCDPHNGGGVGR